MRLRGGGQVYRGVCEDDEANGLLRLHKLMMLDTDEPQFSLFCGGSGLG